MTDLKLELRTGLTELLGRAAQASPADAATNWRFVHACLASGDPERAIATLQSMTAHVEDDLEAWCLLGTLLLNANRADEAVESTRRAVQLAPSHSQALSGYGFALRAIGADDEADAVFEAALRLDRNNRHAIRGVGQAMIRRRDGAALLRHCEAALTRFGPPGWLGAQYLVALALLGRAEAVARLLDYDRLVMERELDVPNGYESHEAFNLALRDELHRASPLSKGEVSLDILHEGRRVKGGPQAALAAFGPDGAPARAALLKAFEQARRDYEGWVAKAGDSLLLRGRPSNHCLWSDAIITHRQGYISLHTHACTWLSAAYYVVVPPGTGEDGKAGCMEFAPPLHKVSLKEGIWPSRLVRPRPGLIALFPAYMYHHVHANEGEGERMVVTFDVMPADYSAVTPLDPAWLARL